MENPSIMSHVSVGTNNYEQAKTFYTELLVNTLGFKIIEDLVDFKATAFGKQFPEFWIGEPHDGQPATPGNGTHIAFMADSPELVDAFHKKALELGATDDGKPGPRKHYGAGYYGAFIVDADGNKIEAMHWSEAA
jgi:catechol 2,3-dioxygenase-like lactoylglutathione lyase family enzyme